MPRKARINSPGALHHIIVRGIGRRRICSDDQDRDNFIERLGDIVTETKPFASLERSSPIPISYFVFGTVRKLGFSSTEVSKRLGVSQALVTISEKLGEGIAKAEQLELVEDK